MKLSRWTLISGTVVLAALLVLAFGIALAQEPEPNEAIDEPAGIEETDAVAGAIPIQGRLTDASGNPLTGSYSIRARLYVTSTGGTALCDDTYTVTADNGLFIMYLYDSASCPLSNIDGKQLYLGITVGSDAEMEPRQGIYPVPYAYSLRPGAIISGTVNSDAILHIENSDPAGRGLQSHATSTTGTNYGVVGASVSPAGYGGYFYNNGGGTGLYGSSTTSNGVYGYSETLNGVRGESIDGVGVHGFSTNDAGVYGHSSSWIGVYGYSTDGVGVHGFSTNDAGVYGHSSSSNGVYGYSSTSNGVSGESTDGVGVHGYSTDGVGVHGYSSTSNGVHGYSTSGAGVQGTSETFIGVHGSSTSSNGVYGYSASWSGVYGSSTSDFGVEGNTSNTNHNYGFYTGDNLYSLNFHLMGATMQVVQNAGKETLELGDVVAFSGVSAPLEAGGPPVIQVVGATDANSTAVAGVVFSRYNLEAATVEVDPAQPSAVREITPEGPVAPGEYLLMVIQGPAQVKASALSSGIQPGDLLASAAQAGYAGKAAEININGLNTPVPGTILGKALEPLEAGEKLIYIFVTLQ